MPKVEDESFKICTHTRYEGLFICQPHFLAQTNMALFFNAVTFEEELFVEPGPSPL